MKTVQVVLDVALLKAADAAAKRQKVNRSALIQEALQQHLKRLQAREKEERDRRGYAAKPQEVEEYSPFGEIAAWPDD